LSIRAGEAIVVANPGAAWSSAEKIVAIDATIRS
jgi:hypothetical protein